MKVLHFKSTMRAEEGGVVKAVLDLCRVTPGQGLEVTLATLDGSAVPDSWREGRHPGLTVHQIRGSQGLRLSPDAVAALQNLIGQADVVHLHSMWNTANPQLAGLCTRAGKPLVLSVHGMLDDWCMSQRRLKKQVYLKTVGRPLMRNTTLFHFTAQAELDQARKWIGDAPALVAPLPLDLDDYRTPPEPDLAFDTFPQLDRTRPRVLFLSRLHYKKGVDRLIAASAQLHGQGVDHQLVIAGTGEPEYESTLRRAAREAGIAERVAFLGFVSGRPKIALFAACDVFALPTSQENFGFVFFESLAAGTPVITTKGTDTWPEILESGAGMILDNTPEAFARGLAAYLADRERWRRSGAAAREWTFERFRADRIAATYRQLYERAAHDRREETRR